MSFLKNFVLFFCGFRATQFIMFIINSYKLKLYWEQDAKIDRSSAAEIRIKIKIHVVFVPEYVLYFWLMRYEYEKRSSSHITVQFVLSLKLGMWIPFSPLIVIIWHSYSFFFLLWETPTLFYILYLQLYVHMQIIPRSIESLPILSVFIHTDNLTYMFIYKYTILSS